PPIARCSTGGSSKRASSASKRTNAALVADASTANQRCQRLNEIGLDADGRDAVVGRHARRPGEMVVIEVELYQRFRMFRHERKRRHHKRAASPAGATDLIIGCRTNPLKRTDPTLKT